MRDRLVVYATFDGIATLQHGIGTQARAFIRSVGSLGAARERDIWVAYPEPVTGAALGYAIDETVLDESMTMAADARIDLRPLRFHGPVLWEEATWLEVCEALTRLVRETAHRYRHVLVLAVDAVYAPLSTVMESAGFDQGHVEIVHMLYSSARTRGASPNQAREAWEQACITKVNSAQGVHIADIGASFTSHLRMNYGLEAPALPFRQSVTITHSELTPLAKDEATRILQDAGIPTEIPLVVAAGRSDPIKGLEDLAAAARYVRGEAHFVVIAVPYHDDDPTLKAISEALARSGRAHTLHTAFDRSLLRALSSLSETAALVVPSRGEPVGMAPQEVALWARDGGPVVVASDCDGLAEQVSDGVDGILFPPSDPHAMAAAIDRALELSEPDHQAMRGSLFRRVMHERDFDANLDAFLGVAQP